MFIRTYGDTDFITGLRAIAALLVVVVHTGAFNGFGVIGENITDAGKYGVQVFFVISGFTIAVTYASAHSYRQYLLRRMFRVAPLYYLLVVAAFGLISSGVLAPTYWMERFDSSADLYNLVMHLTFLSGWDARVANTLPGTEWTIPVEVFWYLILPALLPFATKKRSFWLGLILLLIISGAARVLAKQVLPSGTAHFLPLSYGAYFFLGAALNPLRAFVQQESDAHKRRVVWIGTALFIAALVAKNGGSAALIALGSAMIIVGYDMQLDRMRLLTSRILLFLGSISYSIYLWHMAVILLLEQHLTGFVGWGGVMKFALVTVLTVAGAALTYALVEKPSNDLGKRMAKRHQTD